MYFLLERKRGKLLPGIRLFKSFYEREEDKFTWQSFHILRVLKELKEDSTRVYFHEKGSNEPEKEVKFDSEIQC